MAFNYNKTLILTPQATGTTTMNLIAIETATELCSVGLLHQQQITERSLLAPRKHAELVLGYLDELLSGQGLKKGDIDGIVFGQGPGAFTGVRIAMSVVQGLALALDVPVMAVSTLHNMALQVLHDDPSATQRVLVANDARMNEVYWATFEISNGQLTRLTEDQLNVPKDIDCAGFEVCTGSAFQTMLQAPQGARVIADSHPAAHTLLQLAATDFNTRSCDIIDIQPSYIREKVVFS